MEGNHLWSPRSLPRWHSHPTPAINFARHPLAWQHLVRTQGDPSPLVDLVSPWFLPGLACLPPSTLHFGERCEYWVGLQPHRRFPGRRPWVFPGWPQSAPLRMLSAIRKVVPEAMPKFFSCQAAIRKVAPEAMPNFFVASIAQLRLLDRTANPHLLVWYNLLRGWAQEFGGGSLDVSCRSVASSRV